jgi:uncharacterized membrane protein YhiD involved in acid resistance
MEFLQQLFGNLTSGMIRLAVAVGIIVAVGIFIVKPVLDTTNHAVDSTNRSIEKSFESTNFDVKAIEKQIHKSIEDVNGQVQVQVEHSVHTAKTQGGEKRTEKLLHCVQRANGNVHRMERCAKRY